MTQPTDREPVEAPSPTLPASAVDPRVPPPDDGPAASSPEDGPASLVPDESPVGADGAAPETPDEAGAIAGPSVGTEARPPGVRPGTIAALLAAIAVGILVGAVGLAAATGQLAGATASPSPTPARSPEPSPAANAVGRPNAPVTIEVWADYQCPYCRLDALLYGGAIQREYVDPGVARVVYRDFAFLGQESTDAAVAARCAGRQEPAAQIRYHDALFTFQQGENQGRFSRANLLQVATLAAVPDATAFAACLDDPTIASAVAGETKEGRSIGVTSTPTLRVSGPGGTKVVTGFSQGWAPLRDAIESVRVAHASPSPAGSGSPGPSGSGPAGSGAPGPSGSAPVASPSAAPSSSMPSANPAVTSGPSSTP